MSQELRVAHTGAFGTFRYNPRNDQYDWDPSAINLLGGTVGPKTTYADILAHVPRSIHKPYEEWRAAIVESGRPGSARIPFRLPGKHITLQVFLHRMDDCVHGFIVDVTQDEAESEAMRARLRIMNFAERIAKFGTWAYDIAADSFTASDGAIDLLLPGADPSTFTFEKILDLVHPDQRGDLRGAHERALTTGQVQQTEFRLVEADRWFMILFMRILDSDGNPAYTCGTLHETTDFHSTKRWRMESERLQALHAMRTTFVNAAAHELSQPLTPMRLELAVLAKLVPNQDEVLQAVHLVQQNVERLDYMLRDLLDAARLQAGRLRVHLQTTDLSAQLYQVIETLRALAEKRGVGLQWAGTQLPLVRADAMRVQQCLSNLIHNAIKFTAEGTTVTIEANRGERYVQVQVKDLGPGLSADQCKVLFQPFQQIHASPTGFPSTGLGLYVTKALMEAMQGQVGIDSQPGQGSTFSLHFPLDTSFAESR